MPSCPPRPLDDGSGQFIFHSIFHKFAGADDLQEQVNPGRRWQKPAEGIFQHEGRLTPLRRRSPVPAAL